LIGGIDEEVVEEYEETKIKYESLTTQLADLKKAMEDLEGLIVELDELMKKKRDKAFKEIKKEFSRYFGLLFDGGKADLVELYGEIETEEDVETQNFASVQDGVETHSSASVQKKQMLLGIDMLASPPGKKIKNIQMLSGGERTLTSIALVCAILHTNPSPFVVLDEVEAALDEANTLRFTRILNELALQSQFIIITHNRATMHSADALYGVTMGGDGTSKLVSVKLGENVE
jgi:chromosome segregation protein